MAKLFMFLVVVKRAGEKIAEREACADCASDAIDKIEQLYVPNYEGPHVSHVNGKMVVSGWHGYEFEAKKVREMVEVGGEIFTHNLAVV